MLGNACASQQHVAVAADFLVKLPAVMEELWKYIEHCTIPAVRQVAIVAIGVDLAKIC
jgi:hypothetical protein